MDSCTVSVHPDETGGGQSNSAFRQETAGAEAKLGFYPAMTAGLQAHQTIRVWCGCLHPVFGKTVEPESSTLGLRK